MLSLREAADTIF